MGIRLLFFFSIILIICQKGYMELESINQCEDDLQLEEKKPFLRFYGIKASRPAWIIDGSFNVEKQFKQVHFGHDGPVPLDLCHVKDWNKIKDFVVQKVGSCFTRLWNSEECMAKSFTDLQLFIEYLFTIDDKAVVFDKDANSQWGTPYKSFDTDYLDPVLRRNNKKLKIESILIIQKLPERFKNEIKMMRNDGTDAATFIAYHNENANQVESLLRKLFSAPANLRYGDRSTNRYKIRDNLDPMGDNAQMMTRKEVEWMGPIGKYKDKWCSDPLKFEDRTFFSYYSSNGNNIDTLGKYVLQGHQVKRARLCGG